MLTRHVMAITGDTKSIDKIEPSRHGSSREQHDYRHEHITSQNVPRHPESSAIPMRVSGRLLATIVVLSIVAHGVSLPSSNWASLSHEQTRHNLLAKTTGQGEEPKLRYLGRARLTPNELETLNDRADDNLVFVTRHDLDEADNNDDGDIVVAAAAAAADETDNELDSSLVNSRAQLLLGNNYRLVNTNDNTDQDDDDDDADDDTVAERDDGDSLASFRTPKYDGKNDDEIVQQRLMSQAWAKLFNSPEHTSTSGSKQAKMWHYNLDTPDQQHAVSSSAPSRTSQVKNSLNTNSVTNSNSNTNTNTNNNDDDDDNEDDEDANSLADDTDDSSSSSESAPSSSSPNIWIANDSKSNDNYHVDSNDATNDSPVIQSTKLSADNRSLQAAVLKPVAVQAHAPETSSASVWTDTSTRPTIDWESTTTKTTTQSHNDVVDKRSALLPTGSLWWRHPITYIYSLFGITNTGTDINKSITNDSSTASVTVAPSVSSSSSSSSKITTTTATANTKQQQPGWMDRIKSYFSGSKSDVSTTGTNNNNKRTEGQKELEEEDNLGKQEREAELALAASLAENRLHSNQQSLTKQRAYQTQSSAQMTQNQANVIDLNRDDDGLKTNRLTNDNHDDNDDSDVDVDDDNRKQQHMLSYLMSGLKSRALVDSDSLSQDRRGQGASLLRRSNFETNTDNDHVYTDTLLDSLSHGSRSHTIDADSPLDTSRRSPYSHVGNHRAPVKPGMVLMGEEPTFMEPMFGGGGSGGSGGSGHGRNNGSQDPLGASANDLYFVVLVAGFSAMTVAVVLSAGLFAYRVQQTRKSVSDVDYPTYGVVGPSLNTKPSMGGGGGGGGYGGGGNLGANMSGFANGLETTKSVSSQHTVGSTRSLADLASPPGSLKAQPIGGSTDQLSAIGALAHRVVSGTTTATTATTTTGGNTSANQQDQVANQNAARMYHYHHQKQQMITSDKAMTARHTSASDCDSDEDNDDGAYTVYECPGLASTHEMEVKNPLFLDDPTPVSSPAIK